MKKFLLALLFVVTFFSAAPAEAAAVTNDIVKVGLKYGGNALFSANLENEVGAGYAFGYYDDERNFVTLGETAKKKISMTPSGAVYIKSDGTYSAKSDSAASVIGAWHIQPETVYATFEEAAAAAKELGGYPAYISDEYRVRIGSYEDETTAAVAMAALGIQGTVEGASRTGLIVTVSRSAEILFEFDCQGIRSLGVMPKGGNRKAVTWFKGYKYYGGFEYNRVTGGDIHVINVVHVDDYVKGVIPYEMSTAWPLAALEAQAVCARTYAYGNMGHLRTYGFDVCNTTDCQVYFGVGNSTRKPSANTDLAVDNTSGMRMFYEGEIINAVYCSSNGGASESSENVWGGERPYLVGKEDPYEATVTIPNYEYTVTYTPEELTWVVHNSGYSDMIGDICNVYVSEYTEMGNVHKVTVVDTDGRKLVVTGNKARSLFLSTTYNKNVRSMRFHVSGGIPEKFYINSVYGEVPSVGGMTVISGSGTVTTSGEANPYIITAGGVVSLIPETSKMPEQFVITGKGSGHNVGMSQHGARAMALLGMTYQDILNFYYTGITIE